MGLSANEIKRLLDGLYVEIDRRANTSPAVKVGIKAEVKEIQSTVTQAAQKMKKWMKHFWRVAFLILPVLHQMCSKWWLQPWEIR